MIANISTLNGKKFKPLQGMQPIVPTAYGTQDNSLLNTQYTGMQPTTPSSFSNTTNPIVLNSSLQNTYPIVGSNRKGIKFNTRYGTLNRNTAL
jgi:hypothetical protein